MGSITGLKTQLAKLQEDRATAYVDMAYRLRDVETGALSVVRGGRWHKWQRRYLPEDELAHMQAGARDELDARSLELRVHTITVHGGQWDLIEDRETDLILVVSGRRGGKSQGGARKAVTKLVDMPGRAGQTVCPTFPKTRIMWSYALQAIPYWWIRKVDISNRIIYFHNGSIWGFLSAFRPESLIGEGNSWLHFDESQSISDLAVDLTMPSLSDGGLFAQAWHTGTPRPGMFRRRFEKYKEADARIFKFPSMDNPFIETGEGSAFDLAKKVMDPGRYRREIDAVWESEEGLVYYTFKEDKHVKRYVSARDNDRIEDITRHFFDRELDNAHDYLIGVDYGHNRHFAIVFKVFNRDGIEGLWAVDEVVLRRDAQVADLCAELKRRGYGDAAVVDDAQGRHTGFSRQMEQAGFDVWNRAKNPLVRRRTEALNAMLADAHDGEPRFMVDPKCKELIDCLKEQELINGKPDKSRGLDHLPDSAGYPVVYFFPADVNFVGDEQLAA